MISTISWANCAPPPGWLAPTSLRLRRGSARRRLLRLLLRLGLDVAGQVAAAQAFLASGLALGIGFGSVVRKLLARVARAGVHLLPDAAAGLPIGIGGGRPRRRP